MTRDLAISNDIYSDTGGGARSAGSDCGGDLAGNNGVDLNAGDANIQKNNPADVNFAKTGIGTKMVAAMAAGFAGIAGVVTPFKPPSGDSVDTPSIHQHVTGPEEVEISDGDPAPEYDPPPVLEPVAEQFPPDDPPKGNDSEESDANRTT